MWSALRLRSTAAKAVVPVTIVAITGTGIALAATSTRTLQSQFTVGGGSNRSASANPRPASDTEASLSRTGRYPTTTTTGSGRAIPSAIGDNCRGLPEMRASVDGKPTAELTVAQPSRYVSQPVEDVVPVDGRHQGKVSFVNDLYLPGRCDGNVHLSPAQIENPGVGDPSLQRLDPSPPHSPPPSPAPPAPPSTEPQPRVGGTGWFTSNQAGQIIDPDGKEFIPVGVNANGPDWVWSDPTIGQSANMDKWRFNTLRLNTCHPGGCPNADGNVDWDWHTNDDLDGIVAEYTAKKYVIMIASHMWGGGIYPTHEQAIVDWWKATAVRYKDNPYVWFNLINEPTTAADASEVDEWARISTLIAQGIRSVAPRNMLVMDGNTWGQDKGTWSCDPQAPAGPAGDPWANSGIVNKGPGLQAKFAPVLFSVHVYGMWGGNENWGCNAPTCGMRLSRLTWTRFTACICRWSSVKPALASRKNRSGGTRAAHGMRCRCSPEHCRPCPQK